MGSRSRGGTKAAREVDRQLARYRGMRDFSVTAEPSGDDRSGQDRTADRAPANLPFVIQKHAASHLHYDFRLGWKGVLKSWAVTKGPSFNPAEKRLAVQVEDHPIEYGGFEGNIPQGQYGGGTVMVWDQGTWEPHVDVDLGLEKGSLKFELRGTKLKGNWALVRMGGRAAGEKKANWLLIKEHDRFERGPGEPAIVDEAPDSVVTKRSLEAIDADRDHLWNSKPASTSKKRSGAQSIRTAPVHETELADALKSLPRERMKDFIPPQLASTASHAPAGDRWLHELKLDGYRIQIHIDTAARARRQVKIFTRNGLDWTNRMPEIAAAAAKLPARSALLDGEVVVLDAQGATNFAGLQAAFQEGEAKALTYFAFDLLHLDGRNLRELPLEARKDLLAKLLASGKDAGEESLLRLSEHVRADGEEVFRNACRLGAEGIVSKLAVGRYRPGRGNDWLKVKCIHKQEFVIGGYTLLAESKRELGALLLGYYENGKLRYAGRTGTGFSLKMRRSMLQQLQKIGRGSPAFAAVPSAALRGAFWVDPKLVAEVSFATWTKDRMVRQAAFQGLREDKKAREVSLEEPADDADSRSSTPGKSSPREPTARSTAGKRLSVTRPLTVKASDELRITHPDKVLDEESGLTKRELAEYYLAVAGAMLPYVGGRPLSVLRCPEGVKEPCFFQKHAGPGLPDGIGQISVGKDKAGAAEYYLTLSDRNGLAGLAQMGVLEAHPWSSTNGDLEHPDQVILDLDPDPALPWELVASAAVAVRQRFKKLGLEAFVKTTGGKGLHVVAPLKPERTWDEIKSFAKDVAGQIAAKDPERYVARMTKSARTGKIYLDYLRNQRGATAVAPYSPRARRGIPVALPLRWKEIMVRDRPQFTVSQWPKWKSRLRRDPWAKFEVSRRRLTDAALSAAGRGEK